MLTVAAILVIVSGGIAAYAQGQSPFQVNNSSASSSSASSPPATGAASAPLPAQPDDGITTFTTTITTTTTLTTTKTVTESTTSTTSTTTAPPPLCTPPSRPGQPGKLVLQITPTGSQTGGIYFSDGRGCSASITTMGGIFSVSIELRYAKPVTEYNAVLVANGTSYTLGNMVTGPGGSGQMQNQVLLKPGTYIVSIQIFDTSSNPGQSTLVLQTGQGTIVSPPFPSSGSGQQSDQDGQGDSGHHK
jgi:hypothetical protein